MPRAQTNSKRQYRWQFKPAYHKSLVARRVCPNGAGRQKLIEMVEDIKIAFSDRLNDVVLGDNNWLTLITKTPITSTTTHISRVIEELEQDILELVDPLRVVKADPPPRTNRHHQRKPTLKRRAAPGLAFRSI